MPSRSCRPEARDDSTNRNTLKFRFIEDRLALLAVASVYLITNKNSGRAIAFSAKPVETTGESSAQILGLLRRSRFVIRFPGFLHCFLCNPVARLLSALVFHFPYRTLAPLR